MSKFQIILLVLLVIAGICIYFLIIKFPKKEYKGEELYVKEMPGSCAECKQYRRWFRRGCRFFFTLFGSGAPSQTSRRKDCPLRPMNKDTGEDSKVAELSEELAVVQEMLYLLVEQATRSRRSRSRDSNFQQALRNLREQAVSNIEEEVG